MLTIDRIYRLNMIGEHIIPEEIILLDRNKKES